MYTEIILKYTIATLSVGYKIVLLLNDCQGTAAVNTVTVQNEILKKNCKHIADIDIKWLYVISLYFKP